MSEPTHILRALAIVLLTGGGAALFFLLALDPQSPVRTAAAGYIRKLDADLRFLRAEGSGAAIFGWQVAGVAIVGALAYAVSGLFVLFLPVVALMPPLRLRQLRSKRLVRLEQQLDTWLLVLANALKAVPAIGEALQSSQALMHSPMSEELDVVLKEYRLGTPLDRAIQNMADRMGSRIVTTALTTLQIARRTGGDLSRTLESSAASLREMARLEGVIRTKTADGRNQALVVGSLPVVLIVLLYLVDPEMLAPLFVTTAGNVLLGVAIVLWASAILLALRILKVDI